VIHHHPNHCRRCGTGLSGDDPEPLRHQVWEIPPITLEVIEHQLHRLSCPRCGTSTCAELPPGVETSGYGLRLSGLVGMLGASYPLSIRKVQTLLDQLLGVRMSTGALLKIRQRISDVLADPVAEALAVARSQPVVHMMRPAPEQLPQHRPLMVLPSGVAGLGDRHAQSSGIQGHLSHKR